ncbi:hypothetical protein OENI_60064 [Oenococcus oeni]|nr:hypothetical protein OENI_60064 [Oenococcus oeni]
MLYGMGDFFIFKPKNDKRLTLSFYLVKIIKIITLR